MHPHASTHQHRTRFSVRSNGLLQLSWPHYWLFVGILAGLLGLIGFVFLLHLTTV